MTDKDSHGSDWILLLTHLSLLNDKEKKQNLLIIAKSRWSFAMMILLDRETLQNWNDTELCFLNCVSTKTPIKSLSYSIGNPCLLFQKVSATISTNKVSHLVIIAGINRTEMRWDSCATRTHDVQTGEGQSKVSSQLQLPRRRTTGRRFRIIPRV